MRRIIGFVSHVVWCVEREMEGVCRVKGPLVFCTQSEKHVEGTDGGERKKGSSTYFVM